MYAAVTTDAHKDYVLSFQVIKQHTRKRSLIPLSQERRKGCRGRCRRVRARLHRRRQNRRTRSCFRAHRVQAICFVPLACRLPRMIAVAQQAAWTE